MIGLILLTVAMCLPEMTRADEQEHPDLATSLLIFRITMQRGFVVPTTNPASRWSASLHYFADRQ